MRLLIIAAALLTAGPAAAQQQAVPSPSQDPGQRAGLEILQAQRNRAQDEAASWYVQLVSERERLTARIHELETQLKAAKQATPPPAPAKP